eukprot:1439784-Pyramimonas_sp.AAC.1
MIAACNVWDVECGVTWPIESEARLDAATVKYLSVRCDHHLGRRRWGANASWPTESDDMLDPGMGSTDTQ